MWEVIFTAFIVIGLLVVLWAALSWTAMCAGMLAGEVAAQGVKLPLLLFYELSGRQPNKEKVRRILFFLGIFWLVSNVVVASLALPKKIIIGFLPLAFLFGPPILAGSLSFFACTAQRATEELR